MEIYLLDNQMDMESAIKQHDPFQGADLMLTEPPKEDFKVEEDYFTQLQWISTQSVQVSPRVSALIDYWKDVSIKVLSEIKQGR